VDQAQCGEVYYITWTKQAANSSHWTRVFLYTGSAGGPDSSGQPARPMGELAGRATFLLPGALPAQSLAEGQDSLSSSGHPNAGGVGAGKPMARLLIEDLRLTDEALYKCDVTYVRGKCPSISLARLQVLAPPKKAQIFQLVGPTDQPQLQPEARAKGALQEGQVVGPLNEHEQLALLCLVEGGRPAPRAVYWRKVDSLGRTINLSPSGALGPQSSGNQHYNNYPNLNYQHNTQLPPSDNFLSPIVQVPLNHTLQASDLGARFECHVEHEALEHLIPAARQLQAAGSGAAATTVAGVAAGAKGEQQDALLELHPAQQQQRLGGGSPETRSGEALDAHIVVDLNGKWLAQNYI